MLYTVKQLSEYFNVSRQAVDRWIKEGKVEVIRTPSNRVRITEEQWNKITKGGKK